MLIRARAPLRLGLAGGGTDLSPFCDQHGGAILNATISLYAYATLQPLQGDRVIFEARDTGQVLECPADVAQLPGGSQLQLHQAVYRRLVKDFRNGEPFPCRLTTYCDAPPGSGLGSSSTLVVAMLQAFAEAWSLPMGEYDVAHLAFEIERRDVGLQGGRQDQYAATFGGFNFMEFYADDRVIVNPLRIKSWVLSELEASLVLFFTGVSRASAEIIAEQTRNMATSAQLSFQAMQQLKSDAYAMKEAVLKGNIGQFAAVLNNSWAAKKRTAHSVSNDLIESVMASAMRAGAIGGKVSGAGGGGFITFMVDPTRRIELIKHLRDEVRGTIVPCSFTRSGAQAWRMA